MNFQYYPGLKQSLTLCIVLALWTPLSVTKGSPRGITVSQTSSYSVEEVGVDGAMEYRYKLDGRHFGTLIDQGGTYAFRPHPGCDLNGWGSTWYGQPFLAGAELKHTVIEQINADSSGIQISASGKVSRGAAEAYGDWISDIDYTFDPDRRVITGTGEYTITLEGLLSEVDGDLNLYKIASNYLEDVPLLSGDTGDTGDMKEVVVKKDLNSIWFVWIPPDQPAHFPTDKTNYLSIDVIGQFNNVDTEAMGFEAIKPASKPSLKVILISQELNAGMMFGGFYNLAERQCFWCDNVGITPLIAKTSPDTMFQFEILVESVASDECAYLPLITKP